jgi:hypothetical protein
VGAGMAEQTNDPTPGSVTKPWYQRRKTKRNLIIITSILVLLTLLYSFAPTYIARFVIHRELDKYGIELSGIETLRINPWKMEIWLGPVKFRTGDSENGQLGELGIKVNPFPVFQKHAMVERILVRGIDIYVFRTQDNSLTLNGIPLNQFFPGADETEAVQPEEETTPWGTGLGNFEMQDSRFIYKEKTGGTLTVQIDSLRLNDFISWTPDQAGSFDLKARVNNIEFDWTGKARPFAERITVTANAVTRDAAFPKVIEFTGPLIKKNPIERWDGVYNSEFQHEMTLYKTGRLEGKTIGKLEVTGMDIVQDKSYALAVEQGEVDLDTTYTLTEDNDIEIKGQVTLDMSKSGGKVPENSVFDMGKAHVELADLVTNIKNDRTLSIAVKPKINLENSHFTGQIQLSMDALLNVLRKLQSLSVGVEVSKEQTGLGDFAGDEVTLPRSTITISQLQTSSPKLELTTTAGKVNLDHTVSAEVSGLEISSKQRRMTIATAKSRVSNLQLQSGEGKMHLSLSGNTVLNNTQHKGPYGEGKIDSVETDNEKLELQVESGNISVKSAIKAVVKGSDIHMYKLDELPETSIRIGAATTYLKKGRFAVANQKMQWQGNAGASIDNLVVKVANGKVASTKFRRLELRNAKADQKLDISADAVTLTGLDVFLTRKYIDNILATANDQAASQQKKEDTKVSQVSEKSPSGNAPKMQLQVGRVALVNGAKIRFEDKKVQPVVKMNTIIKSIELRDIDMKNPEKRAQAELFANINEFTNIELKGWAKNLGPNADLEFTGKIENLELPTYSPYAAEFGGVYLESGQFSGETKTRGQQGKLDGEIKLDVQELTFQPLSEEDAKRLSDKAGFPIQTAVGLLQDSNGRISLNFPIGGTINEPDIDISSAISKAIGSTFKKIFPPTMIAGMLSSNEKGGNVSFESIKFKPGATKLDDAARQYADKLATLLHERPVLSLHVCGMTNAEDFYNLTLININKPTKTQAAAEQRLKLIETHKPKLLELAAERTHVVRRYLITNKGLDAKQVGECRSKFDVDDKGSPRVDVTL